MMQHEVNKYKNTKGQVGVRCDLYFPKLGRRMGGILLPEVSVLHSTFNFTICLLVYLYYTKICSRTTLILSVPLLNTIYCWIQLDKSIDSNFSFTTSKKGR